MEYACEAHGHLGPTLAPHPFPGPSYLVSSTSITLLLLPQLDLTRSCTPRPNRSAISHSVGRFLPLISFFSYTVHTVVHVNPEESLNSPALSFVLLSTATALPPLAWIAE